MTLGFFPAIFDCPSNIHFLDQEDNEHIELMVRKHGITNFPWIFNTLVIAVLPVALFKIGIPSGLVKISPLPFNLLVSTIVLWYLLVLAYALEKFLYWYFNIYIITNTHLIEVSFENLMNRNITSARLDDIQSSSSQIAGIVGSLFNFGNVVIETAAEKQRINFLSIPKPDFVAERIEDLQQAQEGGGSDVS
ncbi:MAG: PH domain-containing protein [Patescibacteria group bacterium]|nr:PH domain-containing protein [Patescibacteria group bacterium]